MCNKAAAEMSLLGEKKRLTVEFCRPTIRIWETQDLQNWDGFVKDITWDNCCDSGSGRIMCTMLA